MLDGNARSGIKTELYQQIIKEVNSDLAQRLESERKLVLSCNYPVDGCDEIVRNNLQNFNAWYWVRDSSDNSARKVYCYLCRHTVTLETLAGTTSTLTICGTTLVPPVCLVPLAVTILTILQMKMWRCVGVWMNHYLLNPQPLLMWSSTFVWTNV